MADTRELAAKKFVVETASPCLLTAFLAGTKYADEQIKERDEEIERLKTALEEIALERWCVESQSTGMKQYGPTEGALKAKQALEPKDTP